MKLSKNQTYIQNSNHILYDNSLMNPQDINKNYGVTEQNKNNLNLNLNSNLANNAFNDLTLINLQDPNPTYNIVRDPVENSNIYQLKEDKNEFDHIDQYSKLQKVKKNPYIRNSFINGNLFYFDRLDEDIVGENNNKLTETIGNLKFYNTKFYSNYKFSLIDYSQMDFYDKLELDKRGFTKRFVDMLKTEQMIVSIFLRKSIIYSIFIRIYILILLFFGDFALNTIFIDNDFIANLNGSKKVKIIYKLKIL